MSSSIVTLDNFLPKGASWNSKKTIARCSLFAVPPQLLHPKFPVTQAPTIALEEQMSSSCNVDVSDGEMRSFTPEGSGPLIATASNNVGLTCRTCNLVFESLSLQRTHFKSNIHILNLQRKVRGLPPLESNDLSDGSTENIDSASPDVNVGSDDDSDQVAEVDCGDNEETKDSAAGNDSYSGNGDEGSFCRTVSGTDGPIITFQAHHNHGWEFSFSDILLSIVPSVFVGANFDSTVAGPETNGATLENEQKLSRDPWKSLLVTLVHLRDYPRLWSILILRSGKFAGAVFDGDTVLAHKVFRRYTIRAKSGGSQSSHDSQHGKAASAGAMMRRHGEAMLREDVGKQLQNWQAQFQTCFCILISCPKTMRSVIFDEESRDPPLRKDDKRIRSIPFMVGVPTFEEVLRVKEKCSSVVFRRVDTTAVPVVDGLPATAYPTADAISTASSGSRNLSSVNEELFPDTVEEGLEESCPVAAELDDRSYGCTAAIVEAIPAHEMLTLPSCPLATKLFQACTDDVEELVKVIIAHIRKMDAIRASHDADVAEIDRIIYEPHVAYSGVEGFSPEENALSEFDLDDVINMPSSLDVMETPLHVASRLGHVGIVATLLDAGADPTRMDVRGRFPYLLAKDKACRDAFRKARANDPDRWNWDAAGVPTALTPELEKAQKDKEKEKRKKAKAKKKEEKDKEEEIRKLKLQQIAEEEEAKRRDSEVAKQAAIDRAGVCASCGVSLFKIAALEVFEKKCCSSNCVIRFRRKLAADAALARIQNKAS